ncbi:MAG: Hsp20/alpha crystallin family protein [Bdellovibrionaceae bacterium]|nr:Hsp20/alpha crystallin family protein [Pseudobdellovibrionaceae bacterium]MDW8189871.1 Hsp20/alpha crystallin family protein [Pseudobdellovibrionaceae bacterium]
MRYLSPFSSRNPSVFDVFDEFFKLAKTDWPSKLGDFSPDIDVEEKNGVYYVTADLPGMKKDDIKVDLNDNILTISGERVREEKGEGKYYERCWGKFLRSFSLPKPVDAERVSARYENGVLHLEIPQKETKSSRTIKIH